MGTQEKLPAEKILLRLSAVAVAIGILISGAIVTSNATDEHIGKIADVHNKPVISMLKFIMKKEKLWDEYQVEQQSEFCADQMSRGIPCH